MKQHSRRRKIGLLGPFSFGNLGNAALQQTLVQYLGLRFPDAEFYGCCVDLDEPVNARQVHPFPFNRQVPWFQAPAPPFVARRKASDSESKASLNREWIKRTPPFSNVRKIARAAWLNTSRLGEELAFCRKAYRFAKEFRLLIVGLGGVLDEVWGGEWGDLYCIFRWAVLARLAGTPLVYLSVGVEEINTRLGKFFCRNALSLAEYRSFRDEESKQKVESIGVHGNNHVFPDLAFGLKHQLCNRAAANYGTRRAVGVSPMVYCHPRFWPIKDLATYEGYLNKLASFVSWLLGSGYEVVLFPTQVRMDRTAIEDLTAAVVKDLNPDLRAKLSDAKLHTVDECLTLVSQLTAVVTSRLHGVILSALVGTPVLAISPASKIDRLMEEMELTDYLFNIQQIDLTALTRGFQRLETNRELVSGVMRRTVARYKLAVEAQFELAFRPETI